MLTGFWLIEDICDGYYQNFSKTSERLKYEMVLIKLPIIQVTWELEIIYEWSLKFFKQSSFVDVIIDLRTGLKLNKKKSIRKEYSQQCGGFS